MGKWLTNVEPMVLVCLAFIALIFVLRFLPPGSLRSAKLGEPDRESTTLVRLYYTYWNSAVIQRLIRLNAAQSQIRIPTADPIEEPGTPDVYQEQTQGNTWIAYKGYTTVTPFNNNIDPFHIDRTWHVVIDGDPPEWSFAWASHS